MTKFHDLRNEYPVLIYESFAKFYKEDSLRIKFRFIQSDDIIFEPEIIFYSSFSDTDISSLDGAIFNLGMIELISYYKACCSPEIVVKAGFLSEEQISFWEEIYFNGLGEFLYKNNIETSKNELFKIVSEKETHYPSSQIKLTDNCLIPVGGGKDSVVTLELLKELNCLPLILNPRKASTDSVFNSGYKDFLKIERKIDPALLDLNKKGFLNGHTPFSALLAFVSSIAALITKRKNIILSNENSASQGNAFFSGIEVNHQYSKSFSAEKALHNYISDFIHNDLNYFSLLRPLNELKIAQLFARYKLHFSSFRSCNAGSKDNKWCLKCPKCLFTYIILSPFLYQEETEKIFGHDLFADKHLEETFLELTGLKGIKPFECVGTMDEVNAALAKSISVYGQNELPYLLMIFLKENNNNFDNYLNSFDTILNEYNNENLLGDDFNKILKSNL